MYESIWLKQSRGEPLFPDLLWSRPESKHTAGKLLIIGGSVHGFSAVGEAFNEAQRAGIGSQRILLPDCLQKTISRVFPESEFAPSTPSGSFSQTGLAQGLELAHWADGVLIAGDLGRNSETAVFLEKFLGKFDGQITLTKDAADYAINTSITGRPQTLLVISIAQLQKLFIKTGQNTAITFDMALTQLAHALHEFTSTTKLAVVVKHLDQMIAAVGGQVSTTPTEIDNEEAWRVKTAAYASVWWLQNPTKPFEAITTSLIN